MSRITSGSNGGDDNENDDGYICSASSSSSSSSSSVPEQFGLCFPSCRCCYSCYCAQPL